MKPHLGSFQKPPITRYYPVTIGSDKACGRAESLLKFESEDSMPETKGTNIVVLRDLIKERGPESLERFLAKLTPEEVAIFQTAIPSSWVSITGATHLFQAAAEILHPGDPKGIYKLGIAVAHASLAGLYGSILRFTSIAHALSLSSVVWRIYHNHGRGSSLHEKGTRTSVSLVEDYPQIPVPFLQVIAGFIHGVGEVAGGKNLKVEVSTANPNRWEFHARWD